MTNVTVQQKNEELKAIIRRVKTNHSYTYRSDDFLDEKVRFLADHCEKVLDFGKSSRHRYTFFEKGQVVTVDINQFDDYPDIIDDICHLQYIAPSSFDGIICMAVLEHVYDPHKAVKNLYAILKNGGYCLAYVPFLYRYHAPENFAFQDYFRYTRDGVAYLFRDFSEVTVYPYRGPYSTILNLWAPWKYKIEKRFGQSLNKLVDKIGSWLLRSRNDDQQVSGYYIWAVK